MECIIELLNRRKMCNLRPALIIIIIIYLTSLQSYYRILVTSTGATLVTLQSEHLLLRENVFLHKVVLDKMIVNY